GVTSVGRSTCVWAIDLPMGEGPTLATRPFQAAAMQLTVPDLLDADAVRSATAALRAVDPAATVAADVSRRQLHAGGRLDASAAIAALQAAGLAAALTTTARLLAAPSAAMASCRCGCAFGSPCRCR